MKTPRRAVIGASVLLLTITACTRAADPEPSPTTITITASPSTIVPEFVGSGDGPEPTTPPPPPISGDDNRAIAADVAKKAFSAYIRRDLDPAIWLTRLRPYLTESALEDYRGSDPRTVTATKIVSGPTVVPTPQPELARIHILADDGTWLITLVRDTATDWKVEAMTPPEIGED